VDRTVGAGLDHPRKSPGQRGPDNIDAPIAADLSYDLVESLWKDREGGAMPLFVLPEPPPYRLANAPLVQALAQVRYPLIADFETMAGIAPLQRELRSHFPYMQQEKVQEFSFVTGPAGPAGSAAESVTWHLTDDNGHLLVIGAGNSTLSVGDTYSNFADFATAFTRLLHALKKVGVSRCDRLGVRYLSLAPEIPTESQSWRKWFKHEIIGWSGSGLIGEGTTLASVSQTQLSRPPDDRLFLPGNLQAVVRHGAVPAGTGIPGIPPLKVAVSSYMLDIDVFVEAYQEFKPKDIVEQFTLFHCEIDRFFYWSLTDEGGEHFGLSVGDR
jgi:uncharacterized protein (TIGR04255 family)